MLACEVRLHVSWEGFTPHSEPHAPTTDAWTVSEEKRRVTSSDKLKQSFFFRARCSNMQRGLSKEKTSPKLEEG